MKRLVGIDSRPFMIRRKTEIVVKPWFESDEQIKETVWIMPQENAWNPILPGEHLNIRQDNFEELELEPHIADPAYFEPMPVDIVLGVGFFAKILDRKIGTARDGTVLVNTSFGMVMLGEYIEELETQTGNAFTVVDDTLGERLNKMVEQLWEQDEIGNAYKPESLLTEEQQMVENHFVNTHYRDSEGRFVVRIPFKPGIDVIGSSRQIALRRFMSNERKRESDPAVNEFYVGQIKELLDNGHMVEVDRPPLLHSKEAQSGVRC